MGLCEIGQSQFDWWPYRFDILIVLTLWTGASSEVGLSSDPSSPGSLSGYLSIDRIPSHLFVVADLLLDVSLAWTIRLGVVCCFLSRIVLVTCCWTCPWRGLTFGGLRNLHTQIDWQMPPRGDPKGCVIAFADLA